MFVSWRGDEQSAVALAASHPFFDHFLIVGASSESARDIETFQSTPQIRPPKILYQYPPNKQAPPHVEHFCFPRGVPLTCISRTESSSNLNNLLFGSLWSELEKPDNSYVFLLSGESDNAQSSPSQLFGICVLLQELVDGDSCFFDCEPLQRDLNPKNLKALQGGFDVVGPRCYCFLTRFPFLQFNFQLLQYFLEKERYFTIVDRSCLSNELNEVKNAALEALELYYNSRGKSVLQSANCKVVPAVESVSLELPDAKFYQSGREGSGEGVVADWALLRSFKNNAVDSLLLLFERALLEKSSLVVSDKLGLLSAVLLSLVPMLRPFTFQIPFLPILPESLLDYLDSPVPFLMGVHSIPDEMRLNPANNYVIYFLDSQARLSNNPPGTINTPIHQAPILPKYNQLRSRLQQLLSEYRADKTGTQQERNDNLVTNISSAFRSYHSWLIDQIGAAVLKCISASRQEERERELEKKLQKSLSFLESINNSLEAEDEVLTIEEGFFDIDTNIEKTLKFFKTTDQPFYGQFFRTQLFVYHSPMIAKSINEAQNQSLEVRAKIDSLLEMELKSEEALKAYCAQLENKNDPNVKVYKQELERSKAYVAQLKQSKTAVEKEAILYNLPRISSANLKSQANSGPIVVMTTASPVESPSSASKPLANSVGVSNSTGAPSRHSRKKSVTEMIFERLGSGKVDTPLKFHTNKSLGHRRTRSSHTAELHEQIASGKPILTPIIESPAQHRKFFEV
eukprot:TRINITY_DN4663_c0_g1_i1.p1 TRINITY_DN4663_c0_g1~~TRINITY_DN4663_c0_g1_i1.p1  ORF type:complete len:740 (+),score=171.66 TRINITY_DN4663_c0_g1_i1:115-2334(+)